MSGFLVLCVGILFSFVGEFSEALDKQASWKGSKYWVRSIT